MSCQSFVVNKKNGWLSTDEPTKNAIHSYCKSYKSFLNKAKTEREAVQETLELVSRNGFVDLATLKAWEPGKKVFFKHKNKAMVLAILGKKMPGEGLNIIAAHIDAPRLDVKPNAIREEESFAILETHYYGGIKKYQWLATPLAIHGVVMLANGSKVEISLGENENDPVLFIPDVLPHLDKKVQNGKVVSDAFPGEELDAIIGSIPLSGEEKDPVKKAVLTLLHERYGIGEEDFISSELELVPAGKARDVGLDNSLLGSYGQDDRVCAYACLSALLDSKDIPEYTAVAVLADKEEVGSMGVAGMEGAFIDMFVANLLALSKPTFTPLDLYTSWNNTKVLSADVTVGVDPIFKSILEITNAARLGYGTCLAKYTGVRGKGGTNDANAEYVGEIRALLKEAGVTWQFGELGKVDEGGGGTVAYLFANRGADVIDMGVPLHNMHSLFEVGSKFDIYQTYLACKAFFERNWRK